MLETTYLRVHQVPKNRFTHCLKYFLWHWVLSSLLQAQTIDLQVLYGKHDQIAKLPLEWATQAPASPKLRNYQIAAVN